jgi:phosphate transport system permease protein
MRRKVLDRLLWLSSAAAALLAVGLLLGLVAVIAARALPALDWSFLVQAATEAGAAGGVRYHVLGTLLLIATALAATLPLAVGLALVHGVYLRGRERARRRLAVMLHLLNGIPSILFGIFGFVVFVHGLGWGKSWLTGGLLLGLMILPTVAVSLQQRIDALPAGYLEAAAGLGLTRSQVVWSVVLPQCATGLVTGALLGLARAAGETAPILFTATVFAGPTVPHGIRESPVLALPYHIFVLAQDSFDPAVAPRVWATALVLLALVLGLSLLALPLRLRLHEEAGRG